MTRLPLAVFHKFPANLILFLIIAQLLCSQIVVATDAFEARRSPDVRLLIDVSADSVSQDEALFLRQWLEGFLQLLPADARAGMWRFADTVDEVLPPGSLVMRNWRARPLVNSGALSDLPAALTVATVAPGAADPMFETTIIVLTDSGVNVSASPISNAHAARNILTELAPAMREAGITVHTVALGDEADGFLLRALAHGTNGLDFQAKSVADLPAVMLQLLDITTPASAVVVHERGFTLGESDRELRILMTHLPGDNAALVDATEAVLSKNSVPSETVWHAGNILDVVIWPNPAPGRWQWRGVAETDSVIRVSEGVGILAGKLPSVIPAGSQQSWQLELPAAGRISAADGFALRVEVTDPQGEQKLIALAAPGTGVAGERYIAELPVFDLPGRYRVVARLDNLDITRQTVTWVEVLPTGLNQSITTRSRDASQQNFQRPVLSLAAMGLVALVILAWVLRQRRQRKLELWHRRFQDPD